jgi:hypothetical protein
MKNSRRSFLKVSGAAAAGLIAGGQAAPLVADVMRGGGGSRAENALRIRMDAARRQREEPPARPQPNGDDWRYPNKIGSFTKALPHNRLGEVDLDAYNALIRAVESGKPADYAAIRIGGKVRLVNPRASHAYALEGADPQAISLPPAPAFDSRHLAAEACELYWQAVTRDVPFADYDNNDLIARAASDLSRFPELDASGDNGRATPRTLFRGNAAGDRNGPYVSQFLWKEVPYGAIRMVQQPRSATPGIDYLTNYDDWLAVQNGEPPNARYGSAYRYIRSGRDLASYVYLDFSYQAFQTACLILFGMQGTTEAQRPYKGAPYDAKNPYRGNRCETGFVTFGVAHALDLVARVAMEALKGAWYQKWIVHRRMRPEEFGGRVHNVRAGAAAYPIHRDLLDSPVLDLVHEAHSSWLLPQAYPEGCPIHPAYPAGHAVIAGACATVLKAFFDESFPIDDPVVASADGLSLYPWRDTTLTVGGELDKLASNVSLGRDAAGIHWRSDGVEGMIFGESVAMGILADMKGCFNEQFDGFSLTKFDGTTVRV